MTNLKEVNTLIKEIIKDECFAVENKYQKQIAIEKEPFLRELLKDLTRTKMNTYTASDVLNILERLQNLYNEDDYIN